jgi:hypothetical protein
MKQRTQSARDELIDRIKDLRSLSLDDWDCSTNQSC